MMNKMTIATLALMFSLPMTAQYGRPHGRPYGYAGRYSYSRPASSSYHNSHANTYYGLRIGAAFSTVNSDDHYLDGGSLRTGLNIGAVVGLQIAPMTPLYFETGLQYVEKGGKGSNNGEKFTYDLNYLEVPFVLKYDHRIDHLLSVQPFLGGYVAAGVSGKIKDFGHRQAYSSFDQEGFQRFDAGIKLGCGLQFSYLYAELGYDFGLTNISHDYFDTSHTGSLFATVGVNF